MTYTDTYGRGAHADYGHERIPDDLTRLENLDDWEIAEGEPDPRGYDLIDRDGEKIGTIENLLASPTTQKAHFAIVDTGGWFQNKRFTVPLEELDFDADASRAYFAHTRAEFKEAPEYYEGFRDYDRCTAYWGSLRTGERRERAGATTGRTKTRTEEVRVPVTEETAQVRKEQRQAGAVSITKRTDVETKHISEPVTRTRVVAETREVPAGEQYAANANAATLREGETLRVPIVEEEVVVEKVPRVTKEVVLRKEAETEQVEKDVQLRHERVEVEEEGDIEVEQPRRTR
jgi:uncharacterized protein (TIGR02271 family)